MSETVDVKIKANIQLEIDGKSCCPKCKSSNIFINPMCLRTANIGWVVETHEAKCNDCKHDFTYRTGFDNSESFRWYNPNVIGVLK